MIDMSHPLVVLGSRLPWAQIEQTLAAPFARQDRAARQQPQDDLFGFGALVRHHPQLVAHRRRDAQPRTRLDHQDAFGLHR